MCCDGNYAVPSIHYLNAQLKALWHNANACVNSTKLDIKSSDYDKTKYFRALAQFHYFGQDKKARKRLSVVEDLPFAATFDEPSISIVCQHEAVLTLRIKDGHFRTDFAKNGASRNSCEKPTFFSGLELTYRMPFKRSTLGGGEGKVGNGGHNKIKMLIFDLLNARLSFLEPKEATNAAAIEVYMKEYLSFLQHAGHHVLFNLPDFDDDKSTIKIDYSLSSDALALQKMFPDIPVCGYTVDDINDFLYKKWCQAAMTDDSNGQLARCLSEIKSSWLMNCSIDLNFHMFLAKPRVTPLCSHEVVLTFRIEELGIFAGDEDCEPLELFKDWEIAFIVEVKHEKVDGVVRISLDLDDSPRFAAAYSTILIEETHIAIFHKIVRFMTVDYFDILSGFNLHYIYHFDEKIEINYRGIGDSDTWSEDSDDEEVRHVRERGSVMIWTERIQKMTLFGFDQVLAISEQSINEMFHTLWVQASKSRSGRIYSLYHYSECQFDATLGALTIHLLSNGKAVVFVTIDEGILYSEAETEHKSYGLIRRATNTVGNAVRNTFFGGSKKVEKDCCCQNKFSNARIAFEVELKAVNHKQIAECSHSFVEWFVTTYIFSCHADKTDRSFKHLTLDFDNAKCLPELCTFEGLGDGTDRIQVEKQVAIREFIQRYLRTLVKDGHHVIHSVPIFGAAANLRFGLTSAEFKVITKTEVTIANCRRVTTPADAPVILVLGMCGGRPMPALDVKWLCAWVISSKNQKSIGTLGLSRKAFLEGVLLKKLMFVNKLTTIVPKMASVINGHWKFELSQWSAHQMLADTDCAWKLASADNGKLVYGWEHHTGWSHEHQETSHDDRNGEYALSCRTKNYVEIPTQYSNKPLEVTVKGESSIRISGKTNHKKWKKKTTATWSASIIAEPTPLGLRLRVVGGAQPLVHEVESEGECTWDLVKLHSDYMPKGIDMSAIVDTLKKTLEGTWEYSCPGHAAYALANPVFTVTGDLIASLVSQSSAAISTVATKTTTIVSKTTTTISNSTTLQTSNSYLTASSTTGLLTGTTSDEESPLHTPALEMPGYQIESAPTAKILEYSAPLEMKVENEVPEIVEPYDPAF